MCFQKRLLRGSQIGAMIGRPAGHRTQREHLELYPFAIQIGVGFIPIDLCFNAPVVALRHKGLATGQSQRLFAALHILPHRAASRRASWHLCTNTLPDSLCCVALLPRSLAIRFQNRIDETRLPEPSSYAVAPSSCAALVSRSGSPPAPPADAPAASAPHPGSCLPQTHTPTESARTAPPWLSSPTPASRSKLMLKSRVEVCCVQGWAKTNRQSGPLQNAKIIIRSSVNWETRFVGNETLQGSSSMVIRDSPVISGQKANPSTTLIAGGFKLDQLLVEPFHSLHASFVRHV